MLGRLRPRLPTHIILSIDIGTDTKNEVIVASLTTWEVHHSPRVKPEGVVSFLDH